MIIRKDNIILAEKSNRDYGLFINVLKKYPCGVLFLYDDASWCLLRCEGLLSFQVFNQCV